MKNKTTILITLLIVAVLCGSAIAQKANIFANGIIVVPAGETNASQVVGLQNPQGMEWGNIRAIRVANGGAATSTVTVACTDVNPAGDELVELRFIGKGSVAHDFAAGQWTDDNDFDIITYDGTGNAVTNTFAIPFPVANMSSAARNLIIEVDATGALSVESKYQWVIYAD